MLIHYLAVHAAHLPALLSPGAPGGGPVNNPGPQSPISGNGIDKLISYAKYGALIACAVTAAISGGLIAFGQLSNRPDHADKGKKALLWSLGGAGVVALAIPTINLVFGSVH